jgi:hypothetical protein
MTVRRSVSNRKTATGFRKESSGEAPGPPPPLFTQRTALIIVASAMIGLAAGILTALAGSKPADAVLAGGTAFGAALALLNALIG